MATVKYYQKLTAFFGFAEVLLPTCQKNFEKKLKFISIYTLEIIKLVIFIINSFNVFVSKKYKFSLEVEEKERNALV